MITNKYLLAVVVCAPCFMIGTGAHGDDPPFSNVVDYDVSLVYDMESHVIEEGVGAALERDYLHDYETGDDTPLAEEIQQQVDAVQPQWIYTPAFVPAELGAAGNPENVQNFNPTFGANSDYFDVYEDAFSSTFSIFNENHNADFEIYDVRGADSSGFSRTGTMRTGAEDSWSVAPSQEEWNDFFRLPAIEPDDPILTERILRKISEACYNFFSRIANLVAGLRAWLKLIAAGLLSVRMFLFFRYAGRAFWDLMVYAVTGVKVQERPHEWSTYDEQ